MASPGGSSILWTKSEIMDCPAFFFDNKEKDNELSHWHSSAYPEPQQYTVRGILFVLKTGALSHLEVACRSPKLTSSVKY
jgi:hypothetical protein